MDTNAKLTKQFEDYCHLEFNHSSYEPKTSMSQNDRRELAIIENSAKLIDGHYEISLPWKNNPPSLQSNKVQAESRLQPLKRRLQKDPSLHTKYKEFMDDLLRKNYAEKVTSSDLALKGTCRIIQCSTRKSQERSKSCLTVPQNIVALLSTTSCYRGRISPILLWAISRRTGRLYVGH